MRPGRMIGAAVMIAVVAVILYQRSQVMRLRAELEGSEKRLAEVSAVRDKFLAGNRLRDELIERLREEGREVHRLRGALTGLARTNREPIGSSPKLSLPASEGLGGTVSSNNFAFAGFGSPENGVRSFLWATAQGQYEDWFAALKG